MFVPLMHPPGHAQADFGDAYVSWVRAGGRYETPRHEAPDLATTRSFDAFSVSAGASVQPADGVFFGVTALRTERAPSTEELFSNGPHLATNAFEIGDADLGKETARGVEATARFDGGSFSVAVNGFYTSYRDFIFENATGLDADVDGELIPIFRFEATDATFKGFEAELDAELHRPVGTFSKGMRQRIGLAQKLGLA